MGLELPSAHHTQYVDVLRSCPISSPRIVTPPVYFAFFYPVRVLPLTVSGKRYGNGGRETEIERCSDGMGGTAKQEAKALRMSIEKTDAESGS